MGCASSAARNGEMTMNVSKDSPAHKEFLAKVKELGGWIEDDKVRFPTVYAAQQFERYLADVAA